MDGLKIKKLYFEIAILYKELKDLVSQPDSLLSPDDNIHNMNFSRRKLEYDAKLSKYGIGFKLLLLHNEYNTSITPIIYPSGKRLASFLDSLFNLLNILSKDCRVNKDSEQMLAAAHNTLRLLDFVFSDSIQRMLLLGSTADFGYKPCGSFIDQEAEGFTKKIFEYSQYFPYLSRIKKECRRAMESSGDSFLEFFLAGPTDWGIMTDVILVDGNKFYHLPYLSTIPERREDMYLRIIMNLIFDSSRKDLDPHVAVPVDTVDTNNFVRVFAKYLPWMISEDLSFARYVLSEVVKIYKGLDKETGAYQLQLDTVSHIAIQLSRMGVPEPRYKN